MAQVIDKVAFALHSPHVTLSCCRNTTRVHAFAQTFIRVPFLKTYVVWLITTPYKCTIFI